MEEDLAEAIRRTPPSVTCSGPPILQGAAAGEMNEYLPGPSMSPSKKLFGTLSTTEGPVSEPNLAPIAETPASGPRWDSCGWLRQKCRSGGRGVSRTRDLGYVILSTLRHTKESHCSQGVSHVNLFPRVD